MSEEKRPKVNSQGQKELDKAKESIDQFNDQVKELSSVPVNLVAKEQEPIHKLSKDEISKSKDIYLKPSKANSPLEKFNEAYREEWNFQKEYVQFVAEHREIIGEKIEMWTKPFAGVPQEFWEIPTGKPVWAPRYVAEQIKRCSYRRLKTDNAIQTGGNSNMHFHGALVVDETIHRLDAHPVSSQKSIFMGAGK